MTQLRAGAEVVGADGALGTVDALVVDPSNRAVTHIVVLHDRLGPRMLVPVERVLEATPERATLDMDLTGLDACKRFDEPNFDAPGEAWAHGEVMLEPGSYFLEPYVTPVDGWLLAEHERIPKGEITIRRGDEVVSSDGTRVGQVDEFLVDPDDDHITHVVLRQGHVLRHDDDVVIPVSAATRFEEGRIVLEIDLADVESLPKIPVHRHGHVGDTSTQDS